MTSTSISNMFFPYIWHIDETETNVTCIRVYGLDENNKNTVLRIDNYTPYVYIELPIHVNWDQNSVMMVIKKIENMMGDDHKPIYKNFEYKYKLYYAHMTQKGERRKFPFIFLAFATRGEIRTLGFKIRSAFYVPGVGKISVKMHEQDASEILQLCCKRDIPTSGWVRYRGIRVADCEKLTTCDTEVRVDWRNLTRVDSNRVPEPLIMGFDIEVYSSDSNTMPKSERMADKIFQISCVLSRHGTKEYKSSILTLGEVDSSRVGNDVDIYMYNTEMDLLMGFAQFVRENNPNIIVGYNIFGFDIPYMIDRSKYPCMCFGDFCKMGFIPNREGNLRTIKWSSSAYGTQEFEFIENEGRLFVDLLPLVRRDYKMDTYTLKAISTHFIGDTKEDLSAKGIFRCYEEGIKKDDNDNFTRRAIKYMSECARYCVKDSILVVQLLDKLQTWVGLTEMARICRVQIFDLYTRGQQIKVFSQVYYDSMCKGYVVEKDGYKVGANEHYTGAHVFDPVPGLYEDVIPFDFLSLYPTVIIAYNICWSTFVVDEKIPDCECHVFEWSDHISCGCPLDTNKGKARAKHIMCEDRRYRFLKEPQGILPSMLTELMKARKATKGLMKEQQRLAKTLEDPIKRKEAAMLAVVLDKRQLAYKVSCNSAYGALGVQRGYLPFMPGAMVTTFKGRESIEKVADYIPKKHGGQLVYGDSVTEDTPILCRLNGKIYYKSVDEVSQGDWIGYHGTKQRATPIDGIEVWTETGFTKIRHVIRHKTDKKIFRVITRSGAVDVTQDHGLLDMEGNKVSPLEVEKGDRLMISDFPHPDSRTYIDNLNAEYMDDIPDEMLWADVDTQKIFLNTHMIKNLDKLNAAKLFYIADIVGYSIVIYQNGYQLVYGKSWNDNTITNIYPLGTTKRYVYDLETENHHFAAGVGKLIVHNTDCVISSTPVFVEYKSKIKCLTVDELSDGKWTRINPNKEISKAKHGYKIWSDTGFTDIVNVVRCGIKKPLTRIITDSGEVTCSNEHSLLTDTLECVKPTDVKVNDPLCVSQLPLPTDVPQASVLWRDSWDYRIPSMYMEYENISPMLAFNWGLYFAGGVCKISDGDKKLFTHGDDRHLRVPDVMFNAPLDIRKAFVMGYCLEKYRTIIYISGSLAAAGIYYMFKSIGYGVVMDIDYNDMYILKITSRDNTQGKEIKKIIPTTGSDNEYLYDIQTANHHFSAGVGELVVHNSNYIHFPQMQGKTAQELWEFSEMVASDTTKLFPKPMGLEFEEVIYRKFFIITKKRYMYLACDKDGNVENKIGKKGVILARRDNAKFVRDIYSKNMMKVFNKEPETDILYGIIQDLNLLCTTQFPYTDFVVTKSVRDVGDLTLRDVQIEPILDRRGMQKRDKDGNLMSRKTGMIGEYKIQLWKTPEEREKKLKLKHAVDDEDYYVKCLPAQVQLAIRMRRRGKLVSTGSRLEYVILYNGDTYSLTHDKQYEKIESAEYYKEHSHILQIDYMYYLKALASCLDQILNVVHKDKDFVLRQYKLRIQWMRVMEQLRQYSAPQILLK